MINVQLKWEKIYMKNYTTQNKGPQICRGPLHNFGLTRCYFKPRLNNPVKTKVLYYETEEYVSQLHNNKITLYQQY